MQANLLFYICVGYSYKAFQLGENEYFNFFNLAFACRVVKLGSWTKDELKQS